MQSNLTHESRLPIDAKLLAYMVSFTQQAAVGSMPCANLAARTDVDTVIAECMSLGIPAHEITVVIMRMSALMTANGGTLDKVSSAQIAAAATAPIVIPGAPEDAPYPTIPPRVTH